MSEKIIFEESPEAVRKELREVYFSADGRAFFDEYTARYLVARIKNAKTVEALPKNTGLFVVSVYQKKNDEKYNALEFRANTEHQ